MRGIGQMCSLPGIEARSAAGQRPTAPRAGAFAASHTRAIVAVFGTINRPASAVAAPPRGRALPGGAPRVIGDI